MDVFLSLLVVFCVAYFLATAANIAAASKLKDESLRREEDRIAKVRALYGNSRDQGEKNED